MLVQIGARLLLISAYRGASRPITNGGSGRGGSPRRVVASFALGVGLAGGCCRRGTSTCSCC